MLDKQLRRLKRKKRIRAVISSGTAKKPRLSVYKSNTNFYAQLIDDDKKITIVGIDTRGIKSTKGEKKNDIVVKLGKLFADKAKEKKVDSCVFDRNGYVYHGLVKVFCETVREAGIKI